jgi:hypothetical protein
VQKLLYVLKTLLYGWLVALHTLIRRVVEVCRHRKHREGDREHRAARARCVPISHPAFVRPDPLIYSQYYLRSLGLAVTWDNPDIQLRRNGVPVSSALPLLPDTDYEVVARIWNASPTAPVIQMPVHFSYLDFGAGTVSVPIGSTKVTVGVKGAPSQPAATSITWHTPSAAGHYCLQVRLDPVDDSNFANNLGQENTNVGHAASPATFTFKLGNGTRRQQRYHFEVDAYSIPGRDPCDKRGDRRKRLERHAAGSHPLPDGWQVALTPDAPSLAPDEAIDVIASVKPPDGWHGTQAVNVNAFGHQAGLVGGVTLTVVREA